MAVSDMCCYAVYFTQKIIRKAITRAITKAALRLFDTYISLIVHLEWLLLRRPKRSLRGKASPPQTRGSLQPWVMRDPHPHVAVVFAVSTELQHFSATFFEKRLTASDSYRQVITSFIRILLPTQSPYLARRSPLPSLQGRCARIL